MAGLHPGQPALLGQQQEHRPQRDGDPEAGDVPAGRQDLRPLGLQSDDPVVVEERPDDAEDDVRNRQPQPQFEDVSNADSAFEGLPQAAHLQESTLVLMMGKLRALLGHQMTVARWTTVAVLLGTPYLIVGIIWTATHTVRLAELRGVDLVVSLLGSVAYWPALLFAGVCVT